MYLFATTSDQMTPDLEEVRGSLVASLVEMILYGIHFILFCICTRLLLKRRNSVRTALLLTAAILFGLATADVALTFRILLSELPGWHILRTFNRLVIMKNMLYVTSNFFADCVLLHRCYVIWNRPKALVGSVFPVLVLDAVMGYLALGTELLALERKLLPAFVAMVFCVNVVLTAATAGRIWWLTRSARPILEAREVRRYSTIVVLLVETGLIYSITLLLTLAVPKSYSTAVIGTILLRIVGIMPTMLIVQVEFSREPHSESRNESVSRLQGQQTSVVLDTIVARSSRGSIDVADARRWHAYP